MHEVQDMEFLDRLKNVCIIQRNYFYPEIKFSCYSNVNSVFEYMEEYWHDFSMEQKDLTAEYRLYHFENAEYLDKYAAALSAVKEFQVIMIHKSGMAVRKYMFNNKKIYSGINGEFIVVCYDNVICVLTKTRSASYFLRVVREMIFRVSESRGDVVFHGAAVSYKGKGIYICGDKSAGKTSTMLNFLYFGSDFIANDRIILANEENGIQMHYVPLAIRIGYGTMGAYSELSEYVNQHELSRPQSDWKTNREAEYIGSSIKIEITPGELADIYGNSNIFGAKLQCIMIPSFQAGETECRFTRMDAEMAREVLLRNCMTPKDDNWVAPWIVPRVISEQELSRNSSELIDWLVSNCSVYRFEFGVRNNAVLKLKEFLAAEYADC